MPRRTPVLTAVTLALSLLGCASEQSAEPNAPAGSVSPASASGASPSEAATPSAAETVPTAEVTVADGKVTRESSTFEVKRGQRARIVVRSDQADEVHLHTYDVKVDVAPGAPATLEFTATIPGQFEVELEHARLLLLTVAVR